MFCGTRLLSAFSTQKVAYVFYHIIKYFTITQQQMMVFPKPGCRFFRPNINAVKLQFFTLPKTGQIGKAKSFFLYSLLLNVYNSIFWIVCKNSV